MTKTRKTIFISDLHLDENHPEATAQFLSLLEQCDESVDALYILGDFFEVWIGDDHLSPFNVKIMTALANATKSGLPIYFMRGNRDFLYGKKFQEITGCRLLEDETVVSLYDTPVLLMHGDMLCIDDIKYMQARKFAYRPLVQFIFLNLPLFIRKKIANRLRNKSMKHTETTHENIMDVVPSEVVRIFEKHNVQYMIHGHTHRRAFHQVALTKGTAERIVLGAWHPTGNALYWFEDGTKQLVDLPR